MTSPASTIPAALDALLAAARTGLPDVSVVDGPPLTWDGIQLADADDEVNDRQYLFVGAAPGDATIASTVLEFRGAGNVSRDENGSIRCTALCWSGDEAVRPVRLQAFAILDRLDAAIAADRTLAGAVLYARLAAVDSYDQILDETAGATAVAQFTVAFRSYLT